MIRNSCPAVTFPAQAKRRLRSILRPVVRRPGVFGTHARERRAIAGVEVALAGQAFGEDDAVRREFDMAINHLRLRTMVGSCLPLRGNGGIREEADSTLPIPLDTG